MEYITKELNEKELDKGIEFTREDELFHNSIAKIAENILEYTIMADMEEITKIIAYGMIASFAYGLKKGIEKDEPK